MNYQGIVPAGQMQYNPGQEYVQPVPTTSPSVPIYIQPSQVVINQPPGMYSQGSPVFVNQVPPAMQHIHPGRPMGTAVPGATASGFRNRNNLIFAVVVILYQIFALPIYGVLFQLSNSFILYQDYGGILLTSISTIFILIGMGLINSYVVRSSFTGITYTLIIFVLTCQHFFLFRAFWNKAGANDYDYSSKNFHTWYNKVTLSNLNNDRQSTTQLPSGPFVEAIACSISMAVAFNPVVGRIGLLQVFILTFLGSFFYQVNSQLIYRWFITDNGFGCRIFLFGAIVGLITAFLLGRKETTLNHFSYMSQYRMMAFSLLGFLFLFVSMPMLSTISIFTRTVIDNAVLYASNINAWLALFASVLGTFTASSFLYRKFSVHDLIFTGTSGAIALAMQADICFNPCVPLIVGYVVGFACSIYPAAMNRKINATGVLTTYNHINRFLIPAVLATIVSAIIQACGVSQNGYHIYNKLPERTFIQQGGWQIIGLLITLGTSALAGVLIGLAYKVLNKNNMEDQFNDLATYDGVPQSMYQLD